MSRRCTGLLWAFIIIFLLGLLALLILIAVWLSRATNVRTEVVPQPFEVPVYPNQSVYMGSEAVGVCQQTPINSTSPPSSFELDVDLILVGGGIASLSAAVQASLLGLKTVIVERGSNLGGTASTGAGTVWAPGSLYQSELCARLPADCDGTNSVQRGCNEALYDATAYLNRLAFPTLYNPNNPNSGLPSLQSAKNTKFVLEIPLVLQQWKTLGVSEFTVLQELYPFNTSCLGSPDYSSFLPEERNLNFVVRGRTLQPKDSTDGSVGNGYTLVNNILDWFATNATHPPDVLLGHRVIQLWTELVNQTEQDPSVFASVDELGIPQLGLDWTFSAAYNATADVPWTRPNSGGVKVVGVQAVRLSDGKCVSIRSKYGVFLGTGGFISNPSLVLNNILGPVLPRLSGGGESITWSQNSGDGLVMGLSLGAGTLNMQQAWFQEVFVQAMWMGLPPEPSFGLAINSAIMVNRKGFRIYDELTGPNERARVHFVWSPQEALFENYYTFFVFDQVALDTLFGTLDSSLFGMPRNAALIISGENVTALAANISSVLERFSTFTNGFRLDPTFAEGLTLQLEEWNLQTFALCRDLQFGRGQNENDRFWFSYLQSNNPSQSEGYCGQDYQWMNLIDTNNTLYAVIFGPGMRDTNGGLLTDDQFQVMTSGNRVIDGLYAAGNVAGAASGQAEAGAGHPIAQAIHGGTSAMERVATQAGLAASINPLGIPVVCANNALVANSTSNSTFFVSWGWNAFYDNLVFQLQVSIPSGQPMDMVSGRWLAFGASPQLSSPFMRGSTVIMFQFFTTNFFTVQALLLSNTQPTGCLDPFSPTVLAAPLEVVSPTVVNGLFTVTFTTSLFNGLLESPQPFTRFVYATGLIQSSVVTCHELDSKVIPIPAVPPKSSFNVPLCFPINECATANGGCNPSTEYCVDTLGSFYCYPKNITGFIYPQNPSIAFNESLTFGVTVFGATDTSAFFSTTLGVINAITGVWFPLAPGTGTVSAVLNVNGQVFTTPVSSV